MNAEMNSPRITALIGAYNHERFIAEAIESVLSQDFPAAEMEILVVDDGSTDGTPQIAGRYGARVRCIGKENGGQASVFNRGFAEARGEIIALLDGDDVWLPGKVRAVVDEFERNPDAGLVYHPNQVWNPEKGICVNTHFHAVSGWVPGSLSRMVTYGDCSTSGMAVRRSVVQKLLPVPEGLAIYADMYLACLMIFVAPVAARPEYLTRYRQHAENLTSFASGDRARQERRWACYAEAISQVRAWLAAHGHDPRTGEIAAFLKHQELTAQEMRFALTAPGRWEYFSFLREHAAVHRPLWTRGYRAFQAGTSLLALALGYRGYEALRETYRGKQPLQQFRAALIPDERAEVAPIPAHTPGESAREAGGQGA